MDSWKHLFRRVRTQSLAEQATALYQEGESLLQERRLEEAVGAFQRCVELAPTFWEAWYDLGLAYKWLQRWDECLRCNQRAAELHPSDDSTYWNLGIAATALHDWPSARLAWRGIGLSLANETGPIHEMLGTTPVRLNPEGEHPEVVWCRRIDPVRGIILNIPLPESGHRWGDYVLHDGEPRGQRVHEGRTYSVFNELVRWRVSPTPTLEVQVVAPAEPDAHALVASFEAESLAAEDWTESLVPLCVACSEGEAGVHHEHELAPTEWEPARRFGLASESALATSLLERWAAQAEGRQFSSLEVVA